MTDYTDAASVAAALRVPPDTTLSTASTAGAVSLSVVANQTAAGVPFYPGMSVALDQYNPGIRETVQVTGAVTGTGPYAVPVTATLYDHGAGSPVKEVSELQDVVGAASRMVDDATFTAPGAFSQQAWTETVEGEGTPDGRLHTLVTGRNVTTLTSLSWQINPSDVAIAIKPSQCQLHDYEIWAYPTSAFSQGGSAPTGLTPPAWAKHVLVSVTYTAGYSPIPNDLRRAATVLAARLFKAGDTGFSDVLGSADMGLLMYKKGIPGDIAVILKPWRRWS